MELLEFCGIKDHPTWRTWAMKNHPDRGGDNNKYVLVKLAYEKHIESHAGHTSEATVPPQTQSASASASAPFVNKIWDDFKQSCNVPKQGQCEAVIDKGIGLHDIFVDGTKRHCVKMAKPGQKYCHVHSHIGTPKQCTFTENNVQCTKCVKANGLCSRHMK